MARFVHLVLALAMTQVCSLPTGDALSLIQHQPATKGARFAEGDRVEIPVYMKSGKDATWIPATIVKSRFAGYYDVSVELGTGGRFSLQIPGLAADLPRTPEKTSDWEESSRHYAEYPNEAKQVIEQINLDIRKRARASLNARGFTKYEAEKKMAEWDRAQKAKQERDARMQGCPKGYQAVDGDGQGGDQFGRANNIKRETIGLCMEDCEKFHNCLSFEWSPNTKACNLNKVSEPFRKQNFMDFIYCQRLSKMVTAHRQA